MGGKKSDDRGQLVGILRDEGGCLCGFGAHVGSYLHYPKKYSERSNSTANVGRRVVGANPQHLQGLQGRTLQPGTSLGPHVVRDAERPARA